MINAPPHLAYKNPSVYDTQQYRASFYPDDFPLTGYQCCGAQHAYHHQIITKNIEEQIREKQATNDLLRQKTKESKARRKIWEETHPLPILLTIKKPRVQQDLNFNPICHCPNACQSHPGDTPKNPIHIDLEDDQPRATSAQKA